MASDLPVHREVLRGVREAVFLDPGQETLWTQAFLRMADSDARVSEESIAWLRAHWSVEALARTMKRVYENHI